MCAPTLIPTILSSLIVGPFFILSSALLIDGLINNHPANWKALVVGFHGVIITAPIILVSIITSIFLIKKIKKRNHKLSKFIEENVLDTSKETIIKPASTIEKFIFINKKFFKNELKIKLFNKNEDNKNLDFIIKLNSN